MSQRFITSAEAPIEELPWGPHTWLCRPDLVAAEKLLLVRVKMPAGQGHAFHKHPEQEEIIYILSGTAEQWVDRESRRLSSGEIAHIPAGVVHGTWNPGPDELQFLAILSPARTTGPMLVDVAQEEPWRSLRS